MNKLQWVLLASGIGLAGGIWLGNTQRNLALTVGIASGGALFGGGLVSAFYEQKNRKLTTGFEEKIQTLTTQHDKLKSEFESLQRLHLEASRIRDKALSEVENLKTRLELVDNSLKDYQWRSDKDKQEISSLKEVILKLNHKIEKLEETVEDREAELNEFQENYQENLSRDVELGFEKRKAEVIEKEIAIDEEITSEAIELIRDYKAFVEGIMDRHAANRELMLETNNQAKQHIESIVNSKNSAYQELMGEKQELQLQKQILQQKLDGELVAPEKIEGKVGFYWIISNAILERMYEEFGIPLKCTGLEEKEGFATIGYTYSKSANPEVIVQNIKSKAKVWAKQHGFHSIESVTKSDIFPAIELKVRRDSPVKDTTAEVYKDGLIPADKFCDEIFRATDHRKRGKPTLRIMAATGDGKGICAKNIIAYFLGLNNWEIWLSDPVSASEEDYWDCPKIAENPHDSSKAYDLFLKLHRIRKDEKIKGFTERDVLGIFDEFDKQHSDEQKEAAKQIMTAIRHTSQRQILIGQSAEVGANKWAWDDMKNCSLLALEGSIGTLLKHLGKDMGWSRKKVNDVKAKYEHFRKWAEEQNENHSERPVQNHIRLGLLIVGDSYKFLEVPIAHTGILRNDKAIFREEISSGYTPSVSTEVNVHSVNSAINSSNEEKIDKEIPKYCPKCASTTISEIEPYKNGKRRFRCGKGHKFGVQKNQIRD